jgi:polyisoprenyl-teichoic acid--peptidoglycan teichoic acid transferase
MWHKIRRALIPKVKQAICIAIFFLIIFFVIKAGYSLYIGLVRLGFTPQIIKQLLLDGDLSLNSFEGRTNVLFLGIGGGQHNGADLTDTMMVYSLPAKQGVSVLISLPRDIWSDSLKDKINSAFHYGEEKRIGGGMILTKAIVEDIIGMPIQYTLLIDFSGFKNLIDLIGGIDVNVKNGFTDTEYPIEGKENDNCNGDLLYSCRYKEVNFAAGLQHMDGDTALIYVRSRHAEGNEGSDFARGSRQQEVVTAVKQKMTRLSEIIKIQRNFRIFSNFNTFIKTELTPGELLLFGKRIYSEKNGLSKKITIDSLLENPPEAGYDGKYVLIPKNSFDEVKSYIRAQIH